MEKWKEEAPNNGLAAINSSVIGRMMFSMVLVYSIISKTKQKDKENGDQARDTVGYHHPNQLMSHKPIKVLQKANLQCKDLLQHNSKNQGKACKK